MKNELPVKVIGHCLIQDDLGNTLVDKCNAIHPQNMARVIARALAREPNYFINRIAFGRGGTITDAAYQITYKTPNDGIPPDIAGWKSRLYDETYTEYVDESSITISTGLGALPSDDPITSNNNPSGPGVVSTELGLLSQVVVTCVLNSNEPSSQYNTDIVGDPSANITEYTESPFTFDEIGLFTGGAPITATQGYQLANVSSRKSSDITGLANDTDYSFSIIVDGITQNINIHTPVTGSGSSGEIKYSDLVVLINNELTGATAVIDDGINITYGYLKFVSNTIGINSSISIVEPPVPPADWLFDNFNSFVGLEPAVQGQDAGVDNDPNHPELESERLLAHLVFSPVLKTFNRSIIIKYTLTISVARSGS
jgi:hypothetical protein